MIPKFTRTEDGYYVAELFLEPNADVGTPTINGEVYRVIDEQAYGQTTISPSVSIGGRGQIELAGVDGVQNDVIEVSPVGGDDGPVEPAGVDYRRDTDRGAGLPPEGLRGPMRDRV